MVNDDKQLAILEQNTNSINCINLNVTEVKDNLLCLNVSKADGISNYILKLAADSLSGPLGKLYNKSHSSMCFPSSWKIANVVPIYKKNSVHEFLITHLCHY